MKKRQCQFELLRIIAMVAIIFGHIPNYNNDFNNFFSFLLLKSYARISVNIFLMIGCWFMVDREYKSEHLLKLWGNVWLYLAPITAICYFGGIDNSIYDLITAFFPFWGRSIWYASVYMGLVLCSSILNRLWSLNQKILTRITVLSFLMVSFMCTVSTNNDGWMAQLFGFINMYILIGYYKKFVFTRMSTRINYVLLTVALGTYIGLVGIKANSFFPFLSTMATQYLYDWKSMPSILCAFGVFNFFAHISISNNKIIEWMGRGTFSAYVLHVIPSIQSVLWEKIFKIQEIGNIYIYITYMFAIAIIILIFSSMVNCLRIRTIEKMWINSHLFKGICEKIDGLIKIDRDIDLETKQK